MHGTFLTAAKERFGESTWTLLKVLWLIAIASIAVCLAAVFGFESNAAAFLCHVLWGSMLAGLASLATMLRTHTCRGAARHECANIPYSRRPRTNRSVTAPWSASPLTTAQVSGSP